MDGIISDLNEDEIQNANWFDMFILLGKLSKSIRMKSQDKLLIEKLLIDTIVYILCFAKQNNINMKQSWDRWNIKVDFKHYF